MTRIDIDKEIKAKSIEKAAEKFAKVLTENGYEWASEEVIESVENGYYYSNNASNSNMQQYEKLKSPISNDWTYYWAIENIDGNEWYAWLIERV